MHLPWNCSFFLVKTHSWSCSWQVEAVVFIHAADGCHRGQCRASVCVKEEISAPRCTAGLVCSVVSDPDTAGPGPLFNIIGYGPPHSLTYPSIPATHPHQSPAKSAGKVDRGEVHRARFCLFVFAAINKHFHQLLISFCALAVWAVVVTESVVRLF